MRERITASFVLLVLVLLSASLLVRGYTMSGLVRADDSERLHQQARTLALVIDQRIVLGEGINVSFLNDQIPDDTEAIWEPRSADAASVVATGVDFRVPSRDDDQLSASHDADAGTLIVRQSAQVAGSLSSRDARSILLLLLVMAVLAGGVGLLLARTLSSPFRRLAGAAEALGRGRFDLDLPDSRIPEALAITRALRSSAERLRSRVFSEQAFSRHASHALRTPLTGLRLELEDLAQRSDLPDDARASATRCLEQLGSMDAATSELVMLSRTGSLVEGAEIPLRDLAAQSAQRWADQLALQDRVLTAAVEGSIDVTYTPGPVEQVLELLLDDVEHRTRGAVRMVFEADDEGALRIRVVGAEEHQPRAHAGRVEPPLDQARRTVEALGGRLEGERPDQGLEVLLPRR